MTIINGIEIDAAQYAHSNEIKLAIANNDPIEEKLNVIVVISNPCLYARRYKLLNEFVRRFEQEESAHVNLFIVEMVYGAQRFAVTNRDNKNHLQLRAEVPLWHKENMINLGVKRLLPVDYKAFAWIDADLEFDNFSWACDTLRILNGCKDVVQLFSHCVDMDSDENTMRIFNGFGYSFCKRKKYTSIGNDYWHPGFAWAMTRKAYEKVGGLFDKGILGSGDSVMALSYINECKVLHNKEYHRDYIESMERFEEKAKQLRLGYTPGMIRHYYHGSKKNRQYTNRWKILIDHQYAPSVFVRYSDKNGALVPTTAFPTALQEDILRYFQERKEDD